MGDYQLGGLNIAEVLDLPAADAVAFFGAGEARSSAAYAIRRRLVDASESLIVIEHHLAVMMHADWVIDLGPGAGHDGNRIAFAGTPFDFVAARSTLAGAHLAVDVGA